jgi:thiol-disulfide isomerase/thioredoxin
MNRRSLTSLVALSLLGVSGLAHALEIRPFDGAALASLQGAGKPVAVHFHADWCPTCVNQSRSLEQLKSDSQLQGVTVLVAAMSHA